MDENKELVRQQFGANAEKYVQSQDHAQGASLARLVRLTRPQPDWAVLDVSTGGGHTALTFAPLVARVVATDLAPGMLAAAEAHARAQGALNIRFQLADAENLPFEDDEFDLVTNRIALHHFSDAPRALAEFARVIRRGGLVALVDNIVPPDEETAAYVNRFEKVHDPSHHWAYPLGTLQEAMRQAGLELEHVETLKKDRDLDAWADRSGASPETKEMLTNMLRDIPSGAKAFLNPRESNGRWIFTLEEAILIARK